MPRYQMTSDELHNIAATLAESADYLRTQVHSAQCSAPSRLTHMPTGAAAVETILQLQELDRLIANWCRRKTDQLYSSAEDCRQRGY